ncbi:MAG: CHAT domain-containing protein [Pseudomonadota bacterium]
MFGYETHLGKGSAPVGYAINNIAWVYRRQNDFATSEDWFLRALPIIEKHEGAQSPNATKVRINLGIVTLEQDRPDDAIRWTMRAMPFMISNRASTYSDQRWAFETLSQAMRKKGDIDKAIAFGKLAVNAQQAIRANNADLEKGETKDLRAEWARLYESLASLLIEQGRITEAQAVLNMEKEEEVYNFLRRDASADITKTSALLNDTEVQTSERLESAVALPVAASQKLFELTSLVETDTATDADIEQFFELQEVLETANREFDARVEAFLQEVTADDEDHAFSSQLENVGSQQTNLLAYDRPTALLQVAALPDKTHLFLTLPDLSFYFEVAKDRAELSKLIVDTLQAIDGRAPTINANLKELYDVVFAPAHDALKEAEIEVVMLNLNGVLRYVPFAALYDGERYLVEDFAFSLYSPAYATQFNTGAREVTKTAGFGVTREHPGFDPLPGVGLELETIFAGEDADGILAGPTVLDDEFDVKQLKLTLIKRPEILHIASHFHLQPGREDDSFLLMGDGSRLKLSDIRTTKALSFRGIDLVTLSACQTALGSHDGSEIEGFAAAAQSNGARSVMATLWPVADDATPELMRDFYDGMFNANRTKADALRDAQLAMLHSVERTEAVKVAARGASSRQKKKAEAESFAGFSHPYFWSPFVLMGNWL